MKSMLLSSGDGKEALTAQTTSSAASGMANLLRWSPPARHQGAELSSIPFLTQKIYDFSIKSPIS